MVMSQAALQLRPEFTPAKAGERRRNGNAEARIQAAVVEWIRWCAPQCLVFHPANGGLRSKPEAARLKWMGVVPGIPDLVILAPVGKVYFLEVKTPDGRLSSEQSEMFDCLTALGIGAAIVRAASTMRGGRTFCAWGIKTREVPVRMTERQTLTEQIEAVEIAARNYQAQADQSTVNGQYQGSEPFQSRSKRLR